MLTCIEIEKKIKFTSIDAFFDVSIEFDLKTQTKFTDGQTVISTIECTSGQVKHYTFKTLMQRVKLIYNYGTKEVSNRDRKKRPCLLMEGGCETTTLDSFAYTWDAPDNCVMTKFLTQVGKVLHYPLTTDQKENQFFFLSEVNDTGKGSNIKLKVFPENYELWEKAEWLCKTKFRKSVPELPRWFRNARWRIANKGFFI